MDKDIITILDPEIVAQSQDIIQSLAREGLNHLTSDPKLGWNYVLDHVWVTEQIEQYIASKSQRSLTILDVGCGRSRFHNFLEKRFGINIVGIDRPQGYCHQAKLENADYCADFLQLDAFPENSVDIIYWLSAIEHNEKSNIRKLFQKSMSLLKEGGLFLATFAVSEKTHWFEDSEQTNLSIADSLDIFDIEDVQGDLQSIKDKYRQNILLLRDKYERRYRGFGLSDPDFVVGAARKVKVKNKDLSLQTIPQNQPYLYLFVPSNDTHVHWMYPLAKALNKSCFMVISEKNERADFYLKNLNEQYFVYKNGVLDRIKPNVLVFGCDWGGHEQQVIREAKSLGIPTVCIQEGCLDFADERANRMLYADYAFLQGPVMLKYIRKKNNVFVTGNPKYDSLYETTLPQKPTIMINSNFTYGIYEEARDQWVRDVAETCKSLGLDFFISQHPRDKGNFLSEYKSVKSDAFKLHQQLEDSSILVSRFSTVIYEAAAMGREVVYYNPHSEPFRIFANDVTGGIWIAHNPSELAQVLRSALHNLGGNNEKRRTFLLQHCGTLEHDAVNKCFEHLQAIASKDLNKLSSLSTYTVEQKNQNLEYDDKKNPTVSVIIPCYNTAKYLGQAIDSVLSQTFSDFEIIVVDDGSTDNTTEVVQSFNDSRIHYIQHSNNKGLSAARNTGIRHARGRYICFLDSADYFLSNKLKDQVNFLDSQPDYGLVCGGYLRVDKNGNVVKESQPKIGPILPEELLNVNQFIVPSTLIRQKWIERAGYFDEALKGAEEWDFHCRLTMVGCLMYRQDKTVCAYRFVDDSLSTDLQVQTNSRFKVIEKLFRKEELSPTLFDLRTRSVAYTHLKASGQYYTMKQFERANYHLIQALRSDPSLSKNEYKAVIGIMLFYMDHVWIESPVKYFENIFVQLPEEVRDFKRLQKKAIGRALSHRLLNSYKNKHRDQRCVIIANGRSLKEMDLSFLKNEITIGLDQIDIRISNEDFSPTYYICLDPLLIDQCPDKILQMSSTKFLDIEFLNFIDNPIDFVSLCKTNRLIFTRDARDAIGDCPTSVFAALQLAYFMGFDEVILIGNDHHLVSDNIIRPQTESNKDTNVIFTLDRFGEDPRNSLTDLEKITVAYQMAKRNFEAEGRRIIDATVGNKLAIFPKVDYREIFFSKLFPANKGQKVSDKQSENRDFNNQNKVNVLDIRKDENNTNHIIRWGNFWDELRPDAIINFFSIANSYKELGLFDTAGTLFEKILRRMKDAIDGVDFTSCSEFVNQQEMAECFVSTCTKLAQCYAKQGVWDKVKQIYSSLLNRKNLIIPEQQKQDILNVLKKLQNVKIPEDTLQFRTIESDSYYQNDALATINTSISKPLVSVYMVTYNGERFIRQAIDSALAQTYQNLELLVVDDGSTDGTKQIVESYSDDRIRYIYKPHKNFASGMNRAIIEAKGEYIIGVDSDDFIDPDYIKKMITCAEKHPEVDYFYPAKFVLVDESGNLTGVEWNYLDFSDNQILPAFLLDQGYGPIPNPGSLKRRSLFTKKCELYKELETVEDFTFLCRNALQINFKRVQDHSTYFYRRMASGNSQKFKARNQLMARALNDMVLIYPPQVLYPQIRYISPDLREKEYYKYLMTTFYKHSQGNMVRYGEYFRQYGDYYKAKLLSTEEGNKVGSTGSLSDQKCYVELFEQGVEHLKAGRSADALACFDSAFRLDDKVSYLQYARAVALAQLGRMDDARLACEAELAIQPNHKGARMILNKISESVNVIN